MWRAILCSLLVVLAGCAVGPVAVDEGGGVDGVRAIQDEEPTEGSNSPWGTSELTVAIETEANDSREYESLVEESLAYWEENSSEYAGYEIEYDLDPDAADPDLVIEFATEVDECDNVSDPAGCAPYITSSASIDRPERVAILRGYTDESTQLVLTHELGHTLGLDHDDEPQEVMSDSSSLTELPRTNATERELPWEEPDLTVAIDTRNVTSEDEERYREQVEYTLEFYEGGANDSVPENVTFEIVEEEFGDEADVIITFPEESPCTEAGGSCGFRHGIDVDDDGALEVFDGLTIAVTDVDADAVGWHVGYWVGYGLGFEDEDDWPETFRNASAEDRRDVWWESE